MSNKKTPTLLVILDGWGIAPPSKGNAITMAKKPVLDRLYETYPSTVLGATGEDVGLEDHKMSGSEAGHMNIGAGRIINQDSLYISNSIKDKSFFINPTLVCAMHHAKKHNSNLHVMGLMGNSDSPHSDPEHFRAILELAKKNNIPQVYCHLFTDGRDSYPRSAHEHLKYYQKIMAEVGIGKIATMSGRFYAMDRAKNWKRLTLAYDAIVFLRGEKADSPEEAIDSAYKNGLTDEYLLPTVIHENGRPVVRVSEDDAVIFFNLRSDRARQFTKLFVAMSKESIMEDDMPITDKIKNLYFAAMTDFGPDLEIHTAFPGHTISATLPMVLGGIRQLYIAESEKFAHVTYFLNGGYADLVDGETRVMIESPVVDSYAKVPQMSAERITDTILQSIQDDEYNFIAVNYANADMVGHTGDMEATVEAIEFLDKQIGRLAKKISACGGNMIITADHGNADDMVDFDSDQPNTFHTKNPVPFLLVGEKFKNKKLRDGGVLGNIAPTILDILGIEKPELMVKDSLLR
ncbi:MAG: 2,3-bisphosphoglycerate-independent phosphoglycerate mutase [Candidatus Moranbacteria bacterium]|nr:2,3-bisphosphoglycerate-independent phosphoglycerate mutase [Candidatus Moranbacteria bacterium]